MFVHVPELKQLNHIKELPVLNFECLPDLGGILDRIPDQLALLAQSQINLVLIILALDMRHVDRYQYIRRQLLYPQQRQDQSCEIGCPGPVARGLGRLCRDQGVGWKILSASFLLVSFRARAEYPSGIDLRYVCKLRLRRVPNLDCIDVVAHQLLQVRREGPPVILQRTACWAHALCDVEDDAGEAVLVDVDFLVVWDLAELAVTRANWSATVKTSQAQRTWAHT